MFVNRVSDIPAKIRVKNVDPSKTHMNVCGLVGVPHDGKFHEKNLAAFRPEMKQKVWEALQTMVASSLLVVEEIKDEVGALATKAEQVIGGIAGAVAGGIAGAEAGSAPGAFTPPRPAPISTEDKNKHVIPIPNPVIGDDFKAAGLDDITEKRLKANGIMTYEQFLNTESETLLKIEGIAKDKFEELITNIAELYDAKPKA